MEKTICSSLRAKVGESNVKSCSVTTTNQPRSTSVEAQLNAVIAIEASDKKTATDELVKISNEVMVEVPELAKNVEKTNVEKTNSKDRENTPQNASVDAGESSTVLLCLSASLFLMQIII